MQINATIKVINPADGGTSKTTGNTWRRQEIVLGWNDPVQADGTPGREQHLMVKLVDLSVARFEELECKVGDRITGELVFFTRSYQGRIYNDILFHIF